jgi:curved DNA-binding protein CbpA
LAPGWYDPLVAAPPDYYALFEVPPTASAEEIRSSYRRLARLHHPDTSGSPESVALMAQINEAWEVLRDADRRAAYDRTRPRAAAPRRVVRTVRRTAAERPARPAPGQVGKPPRGFEPAEDVPRTGPVTYTGDPAIDWYAVLGVRPDTPRPQILKVLSRMAGELDGAGISATEFTRRRQAMKDAWAVLGDPHMRAAYDRARKEHLRRSPGVVDAEPEPVTEVPAGYRVGPVVVAGVTVDAGADCTGADLRGADLRGLDLVGICLREAKLQGADFEAASLRRADLRGADLSGARLRWADVSHADCTGAGFRQADMAHASLAATRFVRANLTGASLVGAVGPGINLDYADLSRADFTGAKVTPQLIERGNLAGTIFPDGDVRPG